MGDGARRPLTPGILTVEAARIADEAGLDALTLSGLAARLGVAVPSLYKHVAGFDQLRRHLAVHAVERLGASLADAAVGRSGGDALRALADAYRRFAHEHPGQYEASLRAPDPEDAEHLAATDRVLRTVLAVLAGYGLRGNGAVDAARSLRSALHGFVALEAVGAFGLPRDVDTSFNSLVELLDASWTAADRSSLRDAPE